MFRGPFREQFRERPICRADRIRTCDAPEVFAFIMSLPTVSENSRIPLFLQGTGRFAASNLYVIVLGHLVMNVMGK